MAESTWLCAPVLALISRLHSPRSIWAAAGGSRLAVAIVEGVGSGVALLSNLASSSQSSSAARVRDRVSPGDCTIALVEAAAGALAYRSMPARKKLTQLSVQVVLPIVSGNLRSMVRR